MYLNGLLTMLLHGFHTFYLTNGFGVMGFLAPKHPLPASAALFDRGHASCRRGRYMNNSTSGLCKLPNPKPLSLLPTLKS